MMYTKNSPYQVPLQAGKTVFICQCGKTKNAPFCDGSHGSQNTGITPLAHTADKDGSIWVCGCGKTQNKPFCDGSHKRA